MEQRKNSVAARFWISAETEAMVKKIAEAEGRSASSVYREMLDRGLAAAGYASETHSIAQVVRNAVEEVMRPQVERLATISAKGTQLSAASFFLSAYLGERQVSPAYAQEFESVATQARKLGIEYLKLNKDRSLDDFIRSGIGRMKHE